MATSGSFDAGTTRDLLITDAHLHIGVLGEGLACTTSQITEAARILNMIVKLRAADGMPAWAMKRGTILPFSGSASINSDSHVVTFYDTTTLAAAVTASTSVTITAAGTIANSDQIGIELDNGDMTWTTVSSGGGTTSLVLGTAVTASAGNRVYAYTASADRIQKPIRVITANTLEVASGSAVELDIVPHDEYFVQNNRTTEGTPNMLMYTPEPSTITALDTNGQFFIWPRFENGDTVIEFTYQRPFQDFDAAGDTPDFPQAFHLPLMLELASLLGPKFGIPIEERQALKSEAKMYREEALATVSPEGSFKIQPGE